MKNLIALMTLLIIFLNLNAQDFEQNYLGDDYLQYKGVLLKLKENPITGFNFSFYHDIRECQKKYNDNVIYPDKKYGFVTVKDSLANRIFRVIDVVDKNGKSIEVPSYLTQPILILEDTLTKQKIYHIYDSKYDFNFPFSTSPIKLDENVICSRITKQIDDFTNEIKFSSPISNKYELSPVIFYKDSSKIKTTYYLGLRTIGTTIVVDGKGAKILFTDGTKWEKDVKIDVSAAKEGYDYSAFIPLKKEDLILFRTKKIKKFRLYIYDKELNYYEASKLVIYAKCIKTVK